MRGSPTVYVHGLFLPYASSALIISEITHNIIVLHITLNGNVRVTKKIYLPDNLIQLVLKQPTIKLSSTESVDIAHTTHLNINEG